MIIGTYSPGLFAALGTPLGNLAFIGTTSIFPRMHSEIVQVPTPQRDILGEGPVWDSRGEVLWWVDILGKAVRRFSPANGQCHSWHIGTEPGSLTPVVDGTLLVAARSGFLSLNPESGEMKLINDPEPDRPNNRLNDGKCDRQGRFWAGSMHENDRDRTGSLYRVDADFTISRLWAGIGIPNSLAWSPDGKTMYFAETLDRIIYVYDYDIESGVPHNRRVFCETCGPGYPDGSAVDDEGYLWNAEFSGWRIVRYAPDGSLDRIVEMPAQSPTCCAFGGTDLSTLYVTSASRDVPPDEFFLQPGAGGLFAVATGCHGIAETPFGDEMKRESH